MRNKDKALAEGLFEGLRDFERAVRSMPGIRAAAAREALVAQLVESIHRVQYLSIIRESSHDASRADPSDRRMFEPLKASLVLRSRGDIDEALWLIFLAVHCGRNLRTGWTLVAEIYGCLGHPSERWTWQRVRSDIAGFKTWLDAKQGQFSGKFGNHRKRESLNAYKPRGTGAAVESYVGWIDRRGGHVGLLQDAMKSGGGSAYERFDYLYKSMDAVVSFGRTGKFDYLTLLGNLGFIPVVPGSTYVHEATGPRFGARLLFAHSRDAAVPNADLESWLAELDARLNVGKQVLEDAICNWQKSPLKFIPFRG